MMEQRELFELLSRFEQSALSCLEWTEGDFRLRMEKPAGASGQAQQPAPLPTAVPAESAEPAAETGEAASEKRETVRSPIVGVYYAAPSPDEPPYVKIGDRVQKGQVLCLVEAMKMMNELKSPVDGMIKGIFGINGELVEFDQVLFEVEPC